MPFSFLEAFQNCQSLFSSQNLGTSRFWDFLVLFHFTSSLLVLFGNQMFISFLLPIQSMSSVSHLTFMNVFFVKMGPLKTL